jgi:capsular polysaccharide export protein
MPRPVPPPPDPLLGPWRPTRFGAAAAPVGRLDPPGHHPGGPLAACLAAPVGPAEIAAAIPLGTLLAALRVGGEPNLPDPGARALGVEPRGAVLLIDPHDPARAEAAAALLPGAEAEASSRGLPLVLVRSPEAPRAATPVLPDHPGARRVAARLSPWTLLDAAASVHGAAEETCLLALAAARPAEGPLPGGAAPGTALAALFARTGWTCPFSGRALSPEDALQLLALWRLTEAQNRRVAIGLGIPGRDRRALSALLAHGGGHPPLTHFAGDAISRARKTGGAIAIWSASAPAGFAAYCAERGIPLLWVEEGIIAASGLAGEGARGRSYVLDPAGPQQDGAIRTALSTLLAEARFDDALLARAARLRARIVAAAIARSGPDGGLPPRGASGRRRILVAGDAADRAPGTQEGVRGVLDLLDRVRAENPGAEILYAPGRRSEALPRAAVARLADAVLPAGGIVPLPAAVDSLHCLGASLGFAGLLHGVPVVTWGHPFYAGWGLTEDRAPQQGRGIPRSLDEVVAAALILTPRCLDPVTRLPCPPEILLDRLDGLPARASAGRDPLGAVGRLLGGLIGRG